MDGQMDGWVPDTLLIISTIQDGEAGRTIETQSPSYPHSNQINQ